MCIQKLALGTTYGVAYENTSSADALIRLIKTFDRLDVGNLLILPHWAKDNGVELTRRLDALSIEGFDGVVAISVLGISHIDDALFACLNLRDALDCPDLSTVIVISSERKAGLSKALAIAGFSDLPN